MTSAPTAQQAAFAELPVGPVLLVAPAGCGKTEALALRAADVVRRGDVVAPRRVLGLTFSNKAKENLEGRVRSLCGRNWRRSVTITNFHGLATRLIQSHGEAIGVDPSVVLPDRVWHDRTVQELGVERDTDFELALRTAKADDADDDTVMARLHEFGHQRAIEYEELLRSLGRIDFDDQLRHAARLLKDPAVARLYQAHFGLVMVDEVQDLSMRQLGIVLSIGQQRSTFAGDPAQGIYSFAGAEATSVFEAIGELHPTVITLDASYRSSPAVLTAVNAIADISGAVHLTCGAPENFTDDGHVLLLESNDTADEAAALIDFASGLDLETMSVGVIARRWGRIANLRTELLEREIAYTDWSAPTHIARIVELLQKHQAHATGATDLDRVESLHRLCCEQVDSADADTLDELLLACDALRKLCADGRTFDQAVGSCRATADPDDPIPPGVHLLSGHIGKGQEFNWVVVLGMEEGHVPDFRSTSDDQRAEELRLLHVMLTRARYGLVVTYSAHAPKNAGGWFSTKRSRWMPVLAGIATGTV